MILLLSVVIILLLCYQIYSETKRFEKIMAAIDNVAVNGPLVQMDRPKDLQPASPMSKRGKRTFIERRLAELAS